MDENKTTDVLKPCPICGKEIEVVCIGGAWFWRHKSSLARYGCPIAHSRKYATEEEAIRQINRRADND